jgi:hypothetical protein
MEPFINPHLSVAPDLGEIIAGLERLPEKVLAGILATVRAMTR